MDGRCQHVPEHILANYVQRAEDDEADPVFDTITEPGIDAILAGKSTLPDAPSIDWLKFKGQVSAEHHGAKVAVVVGHNACAGNPVDDEQHHMHIKSSVEEISSWGMFDRTIGLFVGDGCEIQEVSV